MFQSPSLRGSGRFSRRGAPMGGCASGFNPLHCGAVVASRSARLGGSARPLSFNPLHCGAVVASRSKRCYSLLFLLAVSIPFIAGQWSLPGRARADLAEARVFQSPSLRGSGRFWKSCL